MLDRSDCPSLCPAALAGNETSVWLLDPQTGPLVVTLMLSTLSGSCESVGVPEVAKPNSPPNEKTPAFNTRTAVPFAK